MDTVTFIINDLNNLEYAVITHLDGSWVTMLKATYDAQQATLASELSNPSTPQAGA